MNASKLAGRILAAGLLVFLVVGVRPWRIFAQADSGYTLVGTVSTTSFTDSSVVNGKTYQYEVTAFNLGGESGPLKGNVVSIPSSGTHSTTSSWNASVVDAQHAAATGYKVYRTEITIPNPPGAVSTVVN